jgi:hypothetical protein
VNALFPIAKLAQVICSRSAKREVIMLLEGNFDDTGTHLGSPIVGVAGLVGKVPDWAELEPKWQAILAQYGMADFHASECQNGWGAFGRLDGIRRDILVRELARLMADCHLTPISACVYVDAWDQVVGMSLENGDAFFSRFQTPFSLCFEYCVQHAVNWAAAVAENSPIALVFNEQREAKEDMTTIFEAYRATRKWGVQLSTLTFAPNAGRPSVQAAGLLANETFRYWVDDPGRASLSLRPAVEILRKDGDFSLKRAYGVLGLVNAIRRFQP